MAALAEEMGKAWDSVEGKGQQLQRDSGGQLNTLTLDAASAFDKRGEAVVERWVEEAGKNGIDGRALVDAVRTSVRNNSM